MILRKYRPSTIAMAAIFAALVSSAHWIGCTAPSDVPSWLCDAAGRQERVHKADLVCLLTLPPPSRLTRRHDTRVRSRSLVLPPRCAPQRLLHPGKVQPSCLSWSCPARVRAIGPGVVTTPFLGFFFDSSTPQQSMWCGCLFCVRSRQRRVGSMFGREFDLGLGQNREGEKKNAK